MDANYTTLYPSSKLTLTLNTSLVQDSVISSIICKMDLIEKLYSIVVSHKYDVKILTSSALYKCQLLLILW